MPEGVEFAGNSMSYLRLIKFL